MLGMIWTTWRIWYVIIVLGYSHIVKAKAATTKVGRVIGKANLP